MELNLKNKTALVTGGSQGIGAEIATQLANEGVFVAITSQDGDKLKSVADNIRQSHGRVVTIEGDVTDLDQLELIATQAIAQLGRVDILINNVGGIKRVSSFQEYKLEEWQEIFNLNVLSAIYLTKAVIPLMQQSRWGRIIFLSSERAIQPGLYLAPYSMTKAALVSLAKSLANEYGKDGITVNSVSPGVILTPAWQEDANNATMPIEEYARQFCENVISKTNLGLPSDVATLICFLCSDLARWITGSNLRVDGGAVKSMQL